MRRNTVNLLCVKNGVDTIDKLFGLLWGLVCRTLGTGLVAFRELPKLDLYSLLSFANLPAALLGLRFILHLLSARVDNGLQTSAVGDCETSVFWR